MRVWRPSRTALITLTGWCSRSQQIDINEYTDTVSSYIHHCIDDVVPNKVVQSFPNQKPWVDAAGRAKLRARSVAFKSGDPDQFRKARYDLMNAIKAAKRIYRTTVESSYHGSDPRRTWSGLIAITDYKGRGYSETQSSVLLPDELNSFYARFERDTQCVYMMVLIRI